MINKKQAQACQLQGHRMVIEFGDTGITSQALVLNLPIGNRRVGDPSSEKLCNSIQRPPTDYSNLTVTDSVVAASACSFAGTSLRTYSHIMLTLQCIVVVECFALLAPVHVHREQCLRPA